jgi:hypothetical protein
MNAVALDPSALNDAAGRRTRLLGLRNLLGKYLA